MKKTLLIIVLSFICNYSFAQLTFSKVYYDLAADIQGVSVIQTSDNGFMITGTSFYGNLVMKIDSAGGQVWKKYYGPATLQSGLYCISPTNDSCYIVAGATDIGVDANIFCMKIDALGDTLWTKTLATPEESKIFSVQQTYDHGYIMAGRYRTATSPYLRIGVVKLDSAGNVLWSQVITSPGYANDPSTIRQTPDSGYVVWGTLNSNFPGLYAYLIKLSPSGTIQWSKIYNRPVPVEMHGSSIEILNDGFMSFLTGGYFSIHGILMKLDFSGNIIWSKSSSNLNGTFGSFAAKIHQTKDKGFVIAIENGPLGPYGSSSLWRADSSGNFLWAKDIIMNIREAIETNDNGYLILGNGIGNQTNNGLQFGVIKTDSLGNTPNCINWSAAFGITDTLVASNFTVTATPMGGIAYPIITISIAPINDANDCLHTVPISVNEIDSDKQSFIISPNPSIGNMVITFETTINNGSIEILNILGESIFRENIIHQSKKEINLENISGGIYFVKVLDGDKYFCKKTIVQQD